MGQWNYQMRVALSLGTLVLALFSLAVADRFSRVPRAVIMAASAVYLLLMFLGEALTLDGAPPAVAAWLANAVFMGATAYLSLTRPSKMKTSLSPA
jgi:lipopolysaccharide export LptBFGC system permease protein LptF